MKKLSIAAFAAAALLPAAAQAQAYVQVETGLDAIHSNIGNDEGVQYGVSAGYEVPLGGSVFAGVEVGIADSSTTECVAGTCLKSGRDLSALLHLGTKLGETNSVYALGGYTNARLKLTNGGSTIAAENGDGLRLGAGFKHSFGPNLFGKLEYRYSNYEGGVERHNGIVAIGMNF